MPYCLTVVSSNIYVVSTFSRLWDANTALTNVNLCDSDDYSWLHRGTYIPHELNGINIGEIDVDCVTQEEIKSMKRRINVNTSENIVREKRHRNLLVSKRRPKFINLL